ncbi:MAG: hypothetical protein JNM46_04140, partial [Anaerolineales bacterium]|nr:hypothetical protein [Anaerolineales bacterium]
MKVQRNLFKWIGIAFLFTTFISFTFLLPPAFAQEENTETETPTPSQTPLSPEATPEPLEIPEIESESSFQSFSLQSTTELGGDWAAQVNISDTVGESFKPQIAADGFENLHIVWRETVNENQEIFYTWIDVDKTTQSLPVNVSNSPSF